MGYFGQVWLEYDDALGRLCASKYIDPTHLPSGADIHAEAQAMMISRHENVVEVYGADEVSGIPVIRMEYLKRGSLQDEIKGAALPVGDAVRAMEQACRGVEHLHALGLLHRDIKPANLMVGDNGIVKVSDFGLSFMMGTVAGPPPWSYTQHLPPESLHSGRGIDSEVGDVYALGVTAYRLVNGDAVFRSAAHNATDLKAAIRSGTFPNRDAWSSHVHLPLRRVIRRAVHVNADSRYRSAALFRHALEAARPEVSWKQVSFGEDASWDGRASATGTDWRATAGTKSNGEYLFAVARRLDGRAWRNIRADSGTFDTRQALDAHATQVLCRVGMSGR